MRFVDPRAIGRRAWIVVAVALLAAFVYQAVVVVLAAPWKIWNDGRLAPAASLLHGYQLYYGPDDGPILGIIYGPISAIFYVPAVWLAETPSAAMRWGVVSSLAIYFLGPALLIWRSAPRLELRRRVFALLVFALYPFTARALFGPATTVHADAPALGFGALTCAVLAGVRQPKGFRLALAALCCVLSIGAKQVMVPCLLGVLLYLWWTADLRTAIRFAALAAVIGILTILILHPIAKPALLVFNALAVPSGHPLKGASKLSGLLHAGSDLVQRSAPVLVILLLGLVAEWRWRGRSDERPRLGAWALSHAALLPALVGIACLPTAILGRAKAGGAMNTLSFSIYFLALAAALVLRDDSRSPALLGAIGAPMLAGVLAAEGLWRAPHQVAQLARLISNDPERTAFSYVRRHPERTYVPSQPLISLMAAGRADHFSDGIAARESAGFPVSTEHFRSFAPPKVDRALTRGQAPEYAFKFFSPPLEEHAKLDGWIVWTPRPARLAP